MSDWHVLAEERIRAAQEAGAFDNLPGFGRPIADLDGPPDPNWWLKRKLKVEKLSFLPAVLEAKLARERTLERLHDLPTEAEVRRRLAVLNAQIERAMLSPQEGPPVILTPVDVESAVADWRIRREGGDA